jgi:adenylylsulfate kinase
MSKLLIMGLPGSGKTWLGSRIAKYFNIPFWDADVVREAYNDWDFSDSGRERQCLRMKKLAEIDPISISAFIAPWPGYRTFFFPDKMIWMNTIQVSKYEDTNKKFIKPEDNEYNLRIDQWIEENQLYKCLEDINPGIVDTQNFLKELIQKLAKLQS